MAANVREISDMESTVLESVKALEPQIRAAKDAIEEQRCLPPALARRLMEAGVFRMGVPRIYGGPELDPMAQVRVVEELTRIEGAVGWLSMISSAGSFLAAFLKPEPAQRLFGGVESVLAGQLRPPQRADLADGGYRVSGTFHFASGSGHASVMTCGCTVYENGRPRLTRNGNPEIRVMLVPAVKTRIIDVWDTTGMRGTGSNDFVVEDVFVPFDDCPNLGSGPAYIAGPLYSWPALFLVSHAGVPLGLARSALDFVEELSARKELSPGCLLRDDGQVQETIAKAEAAIEASRCYVYGTLENLWATLCAEEKPSSRQRAHYRLMMTHAHQTAKDVINILYDLAATSAIFRSSPLERNMRDILTSSQHRVVHPKMYRPAGRLILGLDPEELFF
ncbi:MAG: indole-3-acetate monooxygenase [Candidatus Binataceae bacterium]|nr:indole-3-acetate monooxygenase [Candidatus Binataceae bacterium]